MPKSPEELANALMGLLYSYATMATGGKPDDPSTAPFVAWFKPGIPFAPEDFRFAQYITRGQGATVADKQADAALQLAQASAFSKFIDFVPSTDGVREGEFDNGVLKPSSATLSNTYKEILESGLPAELPQPEGINEKIAALVAQAEPMKAAYDEHRKAYMAAQAARIAAQIKTTYDPAAELEYYSLGPGLESDETAAFDNWEISGFKTQYENIQSEILALRSTRSPALWLKEALDDYRRGALGTSPVFGEARLTLPFPGSFAQNVDGWSTFGFKVEHSDSLATAKSRKWGASGGIGWGSFKIGGSGGGSTSESLSITNTDGFELSLSIAQIPLLRDWFDPSYLRMPYWKFNPGTPLGDQNTVVSDGGDPPKGILVAYPVSALFVRDVRITMAELRDENSELVKTLKAEGKGGWGFGVINAGGSYETSSSEKKAEHDLSNGTLTIKGMQLVGVICDLLGPAPRPKDGLTWAG
jgi:hypothetical protein